MSVSLMYEKRLGQHQANYKAESHHHTSVIPQYHAQITPRHLNKTNRENKNNIKPISLKIYMSRRGAAGIQMLN